MVCTSVTLMNFSQGLTGALSTGKEDTIDHELAVIQSNEDLIWAIEGNRKIPTDLSGL